jgi:hypothetical protein
MSPGAEPGRAPKKNFNKLVNYSKTKSLGIFYGRYLPLSPISKYFSKLSNLHMPHITTQYHFAPKLYRQDWSEIASQSI